MSDEATVLRTKVDLSGLMAVLGEHLYSTPNVALRELIQNAHDSCHRRRLESDPESREDFEPRVDVNASRADQTLSITDNGAGLTRDEIEKYLATVGSGYTRTLREKGSDHGKGLIGFFGLGFLSAFIIAERTEVHTCSYQDPERAWLFSSRSGQSYTVRSAPVRPVGTTVTLHLSAKYAELGDIDTLHTLLLRYCGLLEFPIHVAQLGAVNADPPPWRDRRDHSPLRRKKLALELASRFEPTFQPLFTLPIQSGGSDAPCDGMLWLQDGSTYATSDNRNVWVFVRGMMVTDEDRELLPSWAGFVGAVVESDALVPTASRESLQKNDTYHRTAEQLRESLVTGLAEVAKTDPESWQRMLTRHNEALLGASLCDDRLFDLLDRQLTVPTSQGDLPVPAVLERSGGKIHVAQSDDSGFEELLFRALKVPVVRGTRYGALPFCQLYTSRRSGQLVLLGTGTGNRDLFRPAELSPDDAERLKIWFAHDDVEVVLARYRPGHLPLVLVPDRDVELKRRLESDEAKRSIGTAALRLARLYTEDIEDVAVARLYVNLECPAISGLLTAPGSRRDLALDLLRSFVGFTAESDRRSGLIDVDQALERFSRTIAALLAGPSGESSGGPPGES